MMPDSVIIAGIGMITPLGLNAAQSAASVRAGLSAFEETSIMDKAFEPFVLATVPDDELPDLNPELEDEPALTYRESRLLRLSQLALDQLETMMKESQQACSIFVGLPDFQSQIPVDGAKFLGRLTKQVSLPVAKDRSRAFVSGRAAGLIAVHEAAVAIKEGRVDFIVAGGVDTFKDLYVLGTLDMEKRVNSAQNMDGFTPGEGAAFLLLTTDSYAQSRGWECLGKLVASASGKETGHLYSEEPYRGDGLSAAIQAVFAANWQSDAKVPTVFSSMNGENHFAKEWGVAYIRSQERIDNEYRIEHPADCIGDTGAACGPIMIALALAGFKKKYLGYPALVYASSDREARVGCLVTNP